MRSRKGNRPMVIGDLPRLGRHPLAIEELPPELLRSAELEVEERKLDCEDMRRCTTMLEFPLARRAAPAPG